MQVCFRSWEGGQRFWIDSLPCVQACCVCVCVCSSTYWENRQTEDIQQKMEWESSNGNSLLGLGGILYAWEGTIHQHAMKFWRGFTVLPCMWRRGGISSS